MRVFLRLLAVELRRARRRPVVRGMVLLALVSCAVFGVAAYVTSTGLEPGEAHPAVMAHWPADASGDSLLGTAAVFLAIGAAVCGASYAGAEWKAGTVATVLTWTPARVRLHLARSAAALLAAFAIAVTLQVVFLATAVPAVVAHGSASGSGASWFVTLALSMLRIALVTALVAVLAVNVATLGRTTAAALVALGTWAVFLESVVRGLRPELARFLIGENVATVVPWTAIEGVEFHRPPEVALVTLLGYLGAVVAAATIDFVRRDVVVG